MTWLTEGCGRKPYKRKYVEEATCMYCGKAILYSVDDTVWLHSHTLQFYCDGEFGKNSKEYAEPK